MGFFFNQARDAKPAQQPRNVIPVQALQAQGCKVCPRDKYKLVTPKFEPDGAEDPLIYLLGGTPTIDEDERGRHWTDSLGSEVLSKLRPIHRTEIRSNFIMQCNGQPDKKDEARLAVECCRQRIIADIEQVKPRVIAGIGDAPLKWATGLDSAAIWRGQPMVVRIGSHTCWYYPLMSPFYVHRKYQGWNENEIALRIDCQRLIAWAENCTVPTAHQAPYDIGIEYITGSEPGDLQRLEKALIELAKEPAGIDLETGDGDTGKGILRPRSVKNPKIWMAAVGTFERTVAFSLDHPDGWQTPGQREKAKRLLGDYLTNSKAKIAHNLGFEMEWLSYEYGQGILRATEWHDTMGMCHALNEKAGTKSLDAQTTIHFGFHLKDQSRVDPLRLLEYPILEALRYNGMDSKWTHKLAKHLLPQVMSVPAFKRDYLRKLETAATLVKVEAVGLPVDFDYAEKFNKKLEDELRDLEQKIADCPEVRQYKRKYGRPLQPTAPADILQMMKDLDRFEIKRTDRDGTHWTTNEEALAAIPPDEVPSAPLLLEHRGAAKLKGTYVEPIVARRSVSVDGRIHCKYSTMIAETNRLAADDPAVQNWPKRKHVAIRGIVYAGNGMWIVAIDYGQIEFRVVGMASEDDTLVRYCWTGYDVHKAWALRMVKVYPQIKDWVVREFEVDWDEKGLKTLRQEVKNKWVFPMLFGSLTKSCAENLHLPEDVADDLGAEFWDEFPSVKKWQERVVRHYEKHLWVETLGGRRRSGPLSRNQIINHPIQGTAAEIVIDGMNAVSLKAELEADPHMEVALNVHDDLSFLMPDDDNLLPRIDTVVMEMCKPRQKFINVPLVVEVSIGPRWSELKEIGIYRSDRLYNTPNPYDNH